MSDIRELDALRRELNALKVREKAGRPLPFTPSGGVVSPFMAGSAVYAAPIGKTRTPLRLECAVFVATTNNASNYWTITLTLQAPGGTTVAQGSMNTSALTAGQWNVLSLTTFTTSPWDAGVYSVAYLTIAKAGASALPGNLYLNPALWVV